MAQRAAQKPMAIASPVLFLAQDRALAEDAWAGDIIGIPNHGQLRIGDALTEGEAIRFSGIPSFAPELLQSVRAGDRLFLMINAANRDPAMFPDPDRLDLDRDPNPHIAFGYGPHYCVGAPLARLEGQIAFRRLLERLDDLRITEPPLDWSDNLVLRGVKKLPLAFRVAERAS